MNDIIHKNLYPHNGYKFFRWKKDGLAPLFVNKKDRYNFNEWIQAENAKPKDLKERPGFHCCYYPELVEHIKLKGTDRYCFHVQYIPKDGRAIERPRNQGKTWILAKYLKVVESLDLEEYIKNKNNVYQKLIKSDLEEIMFYNDLFVNNEIISKDDKTIYTILFHKVTLYFESKYGIHVNTNLGFSKESFRLMVKDYYYENRERVQELVDYCLVTKDKNSI